MVQSMMGKWIKKISFDTVIWQLALLVLCILYFGVYWNRLIPYTEGWGINYAELISSGKVPYRDFYFYMPPLNLLIDWVFWKLSFHFLILYRLLRCLERMVIGMLLYRILLRVTRAEYACFAAFLGLVIETATVYDLLGDYNQTCDLVVLLFIVQALGYADVFNRDKRKEKIRLFCMGIVLGMAFLMKQTIFLSLSLLYFGVLTYLFIIHRRKDYFLNVLTVVSGLLLPVMAACVYLAGNGALYEFIIQVYLDMDSKGSILNILLAFPRILLNYKTIILACTVLVSFMSLIWIQKKKFSGKTKRKVLLVLILNAVNVYALMYFEQLRTFEQLFSKKETFYIVGIMFLGIVPGLCRGRRIHLYSGAFIRGCIVTAFVVLILYVSKHEDFCIYLYRDTKAFFLTGELSGWLSLTGVMILFGMLYRYRNGRKKELLIHLMILTGALSSAVALGMASVDSLNNRAVIILLPYLAACALSTKIYGEKLKKVSAAAVLFVICTICMSQKVTCAYSWWGWEDEVISDTNRYDIEIEGLKGFEVSRNVKDMYEEIVRVLEDNTDDDSVIYGFPHIKIFNILCENYQMNYFVPVPFYDVCSDRRAREDAVLLEQNPPDIVIWCDIPYCMETHETIFREGGALGQRDIQTWFSKAVAREEYVLIAQYDALFVYKKASDAPAGYTFFKSDRVYNSTLKSAEELGIVQEMFDGNGTEEEPYLIRNEEDFHRFRFLVNSGCKFTNCFFRQMKDLKFDKTVCCSSIGKWSEGTYFNGVYDGNGYMISGLNIQEESDTGLFGLLGGTVKDVTLRDCVIRGNVSAGIAAHAISPAALIMDCNVERSVEIYGGRAGGIVDDFSGGMINCRSEAATYATDLQAGKLYGYRVGYMVGCEGN